MPPRRDVQLDLIRRYARALGSPDGAARARETVAARRRTTRSTAKALAADARDALRRGPRPPATPAA